MELEKKIVEMWRIIKLICNSNKTVEMRKIYNNVCNCLDNWREEAIAMSGGDWTNQDQLVSNRFAPNFPFVFLHVLSICSKYP